MSLIGLVAATTRGKGSCWQGEQPAINYKFRKPGFTRKSVKSLLIHFLIIMHPAAYMLFLVICFMR